MEFLSLQHEYLDAGLDDLGERIAVRFKMQIGKVGNPLRIAMPGVAVTTYLPLDCHLLVQYRFREPARHARKRPYRYNPASLVDYLAQRQTRR